MYKFKVTENARKQQGICPECSPPRDGVPMAELMQWGMCARCYLEIINPLLQAIVNNLQIFTGSELSVDDYVNERIEALLKKRGIKREKAPKGWVPGME